VAISIYDVSVPSYLQTLGAVGAVLDKGLVHFKETGVDPEQIVEARLHPDMLPFRFQVQSVVHHSVGAMEGIKRGVFAPPKDLPNHDFQALQGIVAEARQKLQLLTPEIVDGYEGAGVVFEVRNMKLAFTTVGFLASFSLPNFYFHATTAYDILRSKGVPLGKRDYLGQLRLKS
jgi:uncharacterized protein